MNPSDELIGVIRIPDDSPELVGKLSLTDEFPELVGELILPIGTAPLPPEYEGDYTVSPKAYQEVVLPTNGLIMADDVTVQEIPFYTTTNPSGGYTAIIGG